MSGLVRLDSSVLISVQDPLRQVNTALLALLADLEDDEWSKPTCHSHRSVKDLVAHLLHGSLRRISARRGGYQIPPPRIDSEKDLAAFIQQDNQNFMLGTRHMGTNILREMIERYDAELLRVFGDLDLTQEGLGVVWAGEWTSKVWFDVAREYTEKWHHQQQIRDATGRPPLYEPGLLKPVLETFARGLPYAFRNIDAPDGSSFVVRVTGHANLQWTLRADQGRWTLWHDAEPDVSDVVSLPAEIAWKVWTKSLSSDQARDHLKSEGDTTRFIDPLVFFVAIMA